MAGLFFKIWFSFVGILAVADNSSSGNSSSGGSEEMSACALAVYMEVMACDLRRLTSSHSTSSRFAPLNLRLKRQLSNASGNSSGAASEEDNGDEMTAKMCTPGACQDKFLKIADCTGTSEDEVTMISLANNHECMCPVMMDWDTACGADVEVIGADVCKAGCKSVACEIKTACASVTDAELVANRAALETTMETHSCPCTASVVASSAALVKPASVAFFLASLLV